MTKSWKYPGCRGTFYRRGDRIHYRIGQFRRSMKLTDSRENRRIAGERIAKEENPGLRTAASAPRTISAAFQAFLRMARNKKETTLKRYGVAVKFIGQDFRLVEIEGIRAHIFRRLEEAANTPRTLNSNLRHLKALFNFARRQGWMGENPVIPEMFFKVPDKPIEIFDKREMEAILDYWRGENDEMRNLFSLKYLTAFRISEVLGLRRGQYMNGQRFRDVILLPSSKYGDRTDEFPLSDAVKTLIEENPNHRMGFDKLYHWQTIGFISKSLNRSMRDLGIPKQTVSYTGHGRGLHTIRKTRITKWIVDDGLDFLTVVKLSRDNVETVKKYYAKLKTADFRQYVRF